MAMSSCPNIDEQMSQKRDEEMSNEQLSHNRICDRDLKDNIMGCWLLHCNISRHRDLKDIVIYHSPMTEI